MSLEPVKVGIIGSRFEADIHADAFTMISDVAELVAVASPTPGNAQALADRKGIARVFLDYREMLKEPDIDMVTITAPNFLHCQMVCDIARAGKHVVCEKPLCITLEEADEMIDVCRRQGVLLMYAEELLFTPKYCRAKQIADEGALGKVLLVKQCEKHSGPHSDWFWDVERSGGGALLDLGCHGIAFCWWFLGRPKIETVYAQLGTYFHKEKTKGDDEAICIMEFEGGSQGIVEVSWNKPGGMDDRVEVYGEEGVIYADLHRGNALHAYSEQGYGYAVEKASSTKGWTYPVYEEFWNYGIPHEMRHFANCVLGKEEPIVTGEDGRVVQEVIYAAYESARKGQKVRMPFRPKGVQRPIDLWRAAAT